MKYLRSVILGSASVYKPELDTFIVFPWRFNALHFYAYFNAKLHIQKAMNN